MRWVHGEISRRLRPRAQPCPEPLGVAEGRRGGERRREGRPLQRPRRGAVDLEDRRGLRGEIRDSGRDARGTCERTPRARADRAGFRPVARRCLLQRLDRDRAADARLRLRPPRRAFERIPSRSTVHERWNESPGIRHPLWNPRQYRPGEAFGRAQELERPPPPPMERANPRGRRPPRRERKPLLPGDVWEVRTRVPRKARGPGPELHPRSSGEPEARRAGGVPDLPPLESRGDEGA